MALPQSKISFEPHKKHNEVEGSVKKKMGGTLWEEPIFFLTDPGTQLQNLWRSKKDINKRRMA